MRTHGLVGRALEVATLRRAVSAARRRRGGLVLVAGDAGIGKTALVEHALGGRGLTVLHGRARPGGGPLGPLVEAIRAHPAWTDRDAGTGGAVLVGGPLSESRVAAVPAPLPPDRDEPAGEQVDEPAGDAGAALCRTLVELSRQLATAVVVDDLQWADHATLEVLPSLAVAAAGEALLVIGVYRTDELARGNPVRRLRMELRRQGRLEEIALGPLDADDTVELAARVLGARPSAGLAARLVDRSQGSPLFVEELAAALVADGAVAVAQGEATLADRDLPIPETIRDSVLVRTDGLGAGERQALLTAALLGETPDAAVVDELVPGGGAWVSSGIEHGLLAAASGDAVVFRHALVREVLAGELPGPERRARHRRIAEALGARDHEPLEVAEHWLRAGEPREAVPHFLEAASAAGHVHAYRDAAAAYRRALEEDRGALPSRVDVLERLATCLELAGSPGEAARIWEAVAADRAAQARPDLVGRAHARRARALEVQGRWHRAIEARVAAADAFAAAGLPGEAATERIAAAAHLRSAASLSAARELVGAARTEADAAERPDLVARAMGLEGNVLARLGRADEGLELVRQGLALALHHGLATAAAELYQRLADSLEHAGRYDPARTAYLEGADYCRTQSLSPTAQLCLACMAVVLWQTGQWPRAEETARDVLASPDATAHARAVAEGILGIVAALRGGPERARPHLEAALQLARRIELAAMDLLSTWGLAMCERLEGDESAAVERCRRILERWERTEERHYVVTPLRWSAGVFEDAGDAAGVRACADALARIAAQTAQPEAVAALGAALGAAAAVDGDAAAAAGHLEAALEALAGRDLPLERAEIGRRTGNALVRAGRRDEGVALLVAAARTARRLGATPLGAAIATDLTVLGESVERRLGSREARRLADRGLTRRELEIIRLVAHGLTSRDIGRALFISPRTVEMHVGNALVKLDCRTRAEAVQRVGSLGLLAAPA